MTPIPSPNPYSLAYDFNLGANSIYLQEMLKQESLRNARLATISQMSRMEKYFTSNLLITPNRTKKKSIIH